MIATMTVVNSVNYMNSIAEVEFLSNKPPIDKEKFERIKQIVSEFLADISPKLNLESYKRIFHGLASSCTALEYDSKVRLERDDVIHQTVLNLLQGMRFLSATYTKQKQYITLGTLYAKKKLDEAEAYTAKHSLNPTFAHSLTCLKRNHPASPQLQFLATAIGAACYHGNVDVVNKLASCVDLSFGIYGTPANSLELPNFLTFCSKHTTATKKIEILGILNKHGANPFQRCEEGWWILKCFAAPVSRNKPEVMHTMLEGARDLTSIYRPSLKGTQESVLDRMRLLIVGKAYIPHQQHKTFDESAMECLIVMISHGIPFCENAPVDLPPLNVNGIDVTIETAKKVHAEENTKLAALQMRCATVCHEALGTPIAPVPIINLVVSYITLSERSIRILVARNCMKRIFNYPPISSK